MIGRYVFSIVVGVVVTLSLLFVMQLLIATGKKALSDPRERAQLDFAIDAFAKVGRRNGVIQ